MIIFNGIKANKSAYIVDSTNPSRLLGDLAQRWRLEIRDKRAIKSQYPFDLSPVADKLSPDRPLWLLHADQQSYVCALEGERVEVADFDLFDRTISFMDLARARDAVEEIKVTSYLRESSKEKVKLAAPRNISPSRLTLWQMGQIISRTGFKRVKQIELRFISTTKPNSLPFLYGYIIFFEGDEQAKLHMCDNVTSGLIWFASVERKFNRIVFSPNGHMLPTLFELNSDVIFRGR